MTDIVWKSGDWAAVRIIRFPASNPQLVEIERPGKPTVLMFVDSLHPLPAMAAEDAGVIAAAMEVEHRRAQVASGDTFMHGLYLVALEKLYTAVRARAKAAAMEGGSVPHASGGNFAYQHLHPPLPSTAAVTINLPAGTVTGKYAPDPDAADDAGFLARVVDETRDKVLSKTFGWKPASVVLGDGSAQLMDAIKDYRAALTPAPVDKMANLRWAVDLAVIQARAAASQLRGQDCDTGASLLDETTDRLRAAIAAVDLP